MGVYLRDYFIVGAKQSHHQGPGADFYHKGHKGKDKKVFAKLDIHPK